MKQNIKYGLIVIVAGILASSNAAADDSIRGVWIDPSGKVGVGTKSPDTDFHVKGDMKADGSITGQGYQGRYGTAAAIGGFNTLGKPATFLFSFDEASFGKTPKAIQIFNPESNIFKTFIIDHPLDKKRYLIHATLEGPEGAVYYRGSAQLEQGKAIVELPYYFDALTESKGVTLQLTNIDGFDPLAVKTEQGSKIVNGKFTVVSSNTTSMQLFDWEVKAVRKDKPRLIVDPYKSETLVEGFGPYRYIRNQ